MKVIGRVPASGINDRLRSCDLCDATELEHLLNSDGPADGSLLPMFKAEEDNIEYTICANCADKEAEVA